MMLESSKIIVHVKREVFEIFDKKVDDKDGDKKIITTATIMAH